MVIRGGDLCVLHGQFLASSFQFVNVNSRVEERQDRLLFLTPCGYCVGSPLERKANLVTGKKVATDKILDQT